MCMLYVSTPLYFKNFSHKGLTKYCEVLCVMKRNLNSMICTVHTNDAKKPPPHKKKWDWIWRKCSILVWANCQTGTPEEDINTDKWKTTNTDKLGKETWCVLGYQALSHRVKWTNQGIFWRWKITRTPKSKAFFLGTPGMLETLRCL